MNLAVAGSSAATRGIVKNANTRPAALQKSVPFGCRRTRRSTSARSVPLAPKPNKATLMTR